MIPTDSPIATGLHRKLTGRFKHLDLHSCPLKPCNGQESLRNAFFCFNVNRTYRFSGIWMPLRPSNRKLTIPLSLSHEREGK